MIPYGRQHVTEDDINAVVNVMRSDYLTQGPVVPKFQKAVAARCGAAYAVATNSATSALHLACIALDLGKGDWLWTSPNTFVASANCGLYCGARVDFVDINPRTYNMCPGALARKLADAEPLGLLPKIVVPVHFAGQSCDMAAISDLSRRYGFKVIEDASHAIGATYRGAPVGSCRYSAVTVLSFHPVKIITSGEGGMALTNSSELAARMARLAAHGITREPALMSAAEGAWCYQQVELGLNYRMTDLHAALGLSQLSRLAQYVDQRHEIARRYDESLADLPLTCPYRSQESHSALHLYPIWIDPDRFDRKQVFDLLRTVGIGVNVHYIPVHTQPYYRGLGFPFATFPNAERYYAGALTIPLHPSMSEEDQDHVVQTLSDLLQ